MIFTTFQRKYNSLGQIEINQQSNMNMRKRRKIARSIQSLLPNNSLFQSQQRNFNRSKESARLLCSQKKLGKKKRFYSLCKKKDYFTQRKMSNKLRMRLIEV